MTEPVPAPGAAETEASPVPLATDDQRRTFEFLCPKVTSQAELLQFHAVDGMIRDLRTRRLAENARLLALEKLWEAHKSKLEPELQAMVVQAQASGSKSAQSMLASTFTKDREDTVKIHDDEAALAWAETFDPFLVETDFDVIRKLTPEGRARVGKLILGRAKAGLDIPEGVVITPAGKTVVTRHRSGGKLTPQQVLAQRGALDQLTNPETLDQPDQDDLDDTSSPS